MSVLSGRLWLYLSWFWERNGGGAKHTQIRAKAFKVTQSNKIKQGAGYVHLSRCWTLRVEQLALPAWRPGKRGSSRRRRSLSDARRASRLSAGLAKYLMGIFSDQIYSYFKFKPLSKFAIWKRWIRASLTNSVKGSKNQYRVCFQQPN